MNQQTFTDVVGLCILLAAMLFSNDVANVVGPYIVIVVASAIGASFKLGRSEKASRLAAVFFFLRSACIAMLLTVSAAAFVHNYHPGLHERFLLAPIALLLGWTDWPSTFRRVTKLLWGGLDLIRGTEKGGTQ